MKFQMMLDSTEYEQVERYQTILLVEPDSPMAERILHEFRKAGIPAIHYARIEEAVGRWEQDAGVLAVLDESQLCIRGEHVAHRITGRWPGRACSYIVLTSVPDYRKAVSYLKMGALDYLVKDENIAMFLPGLVAQQLGRLNAELELKQSQRALLDNEIELRRITENIEDVLIKTDLQYGCTYVSGAFHKVFQIPVCMLMGKSLFTYIHPEDVQNVTVRLRDVVCTRNTGKFEFRMRRESGHYIWIEAIGAPMRDEFGIVYGMILTLRDITHRKMIDRQLTEERNFINAVLETVGSQIAVLTMAGEIIRYNRAIEQMTGYLADEIIGECFWSIIGSEEDRTRFKEHFYAIREGRKTPEFECRILTRNNELRVVRMSLTRITGEPSAENYIVCTGMDITVRIQDEERLRESEERWQFALEGSGAGVRDWDMNSGRMIFSAQWKRMLGYRNPDVQENRNFWEACIHPEDKSEVLRKLEEHLKGHLRDYEAEYRMRCRDGSWLWVLDRGKVMRFGDDGRPLRMVCTQTDISNRKTIEAEILYMSFHDKLTGLYNRSYYEEEMARLDTARQLPLSIIVGDVNGLKLINDAFGHDEGDRLIQAAAEVLKKTCRTDDIIARIGGDEFSILLPNTDEETALHVAARIRQNCEYAELELIKLSIAIGVGTKNSPEEELSAVFKMADDRMYKSKLVESKSLKSSIIASLRKTLHERTVEMGEHSERLKVLALQLGQRMGFNANDLDDLELLALLHDIGKIAVPDHILNKPEELTADEWEIMRKHSEVGFRIASTTPELSNIAEYILCHHEWMDGSGYPQGLTGESIPLVARVLAVVDAFDAMISHRSYRGSRSCEEALTELERYSGKQFDAGIVREFVMMIREPSAQRMFS